jgi:hypothetical protein
MSRADSFVVVAIPLSRPDIVGFLLPPAPEPRGAELYIVGQRPSPQAEAIWMEKLIITPKPTINDLLIIDDPHGHLVETRTDRLLPVESLAIPHFLTRDLGGWVANFFGPIGLCLNGPEDPLLNHAEILTEYGPQIRYVGADSNLVATRLEEEAGGNLTTVASFFYRLHILRQQMMDRPMTFAERIYFEIANETYFAENGQPPLPVDLLYDELLGWLVRLELRRRQALARHDEEAATIIKKWQLTHQEESGLRLILQNEYIVGRHRRSTVLIAPELGVVIKQPGPEPFHEIELGAKFVQGRRENWPSITRDGSLVTPRGRVRLILEEGVIPRLSQVFKHKLRLSTLLGLTVEPFVPGKAVQELVLEDHSQLTPQLYENIVLHQQVCELLGIDNNDWHAPNFIRRDRDGQLIHVDWGAARPLQPDELSPADKMARVNQVRNMAFSFKNPELASRLLSIHADLVADENRLAKLRRRAQAMIELSGSTVQVGGEKLEGELKSFD